MAFDEERKFRNALEHIALVCLYVLLGKDGKLDELISERIADIIAKGVMYQARITAWSIKVQAGPGREFDDLQILKNGEIVDVLEEANGYARIGTRQWLNMRWLKRV